MIRVRRLYDPPGDDEGTLVLVDRLWPRGLAKAKAPFQHWFPKIGPSNELRHWYGHDPTRWDEFRKRYFAELDADPEAVAPLREIMAAGDVTLLFTSAERERNNAHALAEYLASHP